MFVHFSRIAEFSDYGEIRIQETMCFITLPLMPMRSALLCQAKHHIVLSGDAFLRSIGAQALHGGLAKNLSLIFFYNIL